MKKYLIILLLLQSILLCQNIDNNEIIDSTKIRVRLTENFGWGSGTRTKLSFTLLSDGEYIYQYFLDHDKKVDSRNIADTEKLNRIIAIIRESELDNFPRYLRSEEAVGPSSVVSIIYRDQGSNKLRKVSYDTGSTEKSEEMELFSEIYEKLLTELRSIK